jgi:uncharacterized protein YecE (DUF72 family)
MGDSLKIGLCGYAGAAAGREDFCVGEIEETFYDAVRPGTLELWRAQAPPSFEFTMRAAQLITHGPTSSAYRRLKQPLSRREQSECGGFRWNETVRAAWERTADSARLLGATAILFQCPASFRATLQSVDNMQRFFEEVGKPASFAFLWEPRGPWPDAAIADVCAPLGLTHVVDPFVRKPVTQGLTYWRLHGRGSQDVSYTDEELVALRDQVDPAGQTYALFNNIPRAGDAQRFARIVSGKGLRGADEPERPGP